MSDWTFRLLEILLPAVVALVGAVLYFATVYLQARAEKIESEWLREKVEDILYRARTAVYEAVKATAQVYVDDLKAKRADGKLTAEEAEEARRIAFTHFKTILGDKGMAELQVIVGDVVAYFESLVEAAVNDLKGRRSNG